MTGSLLFQKQKLHTRIKTKKMDSRLFELGPVCWLELFTGKSEVLFSTAISTVIDNREGPRSLDSDNVTVIYPVIAISKNIWS